ncbi:MAG TPA: TetR/AcrR family transcriptional regulator [Streptosporangiaceae bacterium]|jgi:AcrR family transcriptional regulator
MIGDEMITAATAEQAGGHRGGRPRSERADKAIIEATLDLLAAEGGVDAVSIEAVAARAGVGKTTIYRRWPGKESLIVDALAAIKAPPPEPLGESVRDDLIAQLDAKRMDTMDPRLGCLFWTVQSSAEKYPELAQQYAARIVEPRRDKLRQIVRRGIEAGEIRADLDIDVSLLFLSGAVHNRNRFPAEPLPDDYITRVVDLFLDGARTR